MKIAQIPPLFEAVPPRLYGGTERVVAQLCEALVDLGHEVTLFCSAEASTRAQKVVVRDQAIRLDPALKSDVAAHLCMLDEVRARRSDFDIIHFHTDMLQFPLFEDDPSRTVTTLHGRLDLKDLPGVYRRWPKFPLVSISDAQRRHLPFANWVATVYHGMAAGLSWFSPRPQGYLAFLGRISPEKRVDRAIEVACRTGMPLRVAAKVDNADREYFKDRIEPLLREHRSLVEFVGELGGRDKDAFLGGAHALLFPIDWPEPFGLVMIEAMACGTPVIAYPCGSAPEVVDHGVSGYLVADESEAVAAVRAIDRLDRRQVRRRFDRRFSATAMARGYLDVYADRLAKAPFAPELARAEADMLQEASTVPASLAQIA